MVGVVVGAVVVVGTEKSTNIVILLDFHDE